MAKKKEEEVKTPEETPPQDENSIRKTPNVEGDFSTLLHDYGIKEDKAAVITSYTSSTESLTTSSTLKASICRQKGELPESPTIALLRLSET